MSPAQPGGVNTPPLVAAASSLIRSTRSDAAPTRTARPWLITAWTESRPPRVVYSSDDEFGAVL